MKLSTVTFPDSEAVTKKILWLCDEFTDVSSWAVTTSLWKQWWTFYEMNTHKSKNLSKAQVKFQVFHVQTFVLVDI